MFKQILRYILLSLFGVALLACCWYGHHVTVRGNNGIICTKLNVEITDGTENTFVDREDVDALINREYGSFYGKQIDSLNLCRIEEAIQKHTAVKNSEVYVQRDSTLNITLAMKEPYVRFQKGGRGFYAEKDGSIFPLQARHTAMVPIIDGMIPVDVEPGYCGLAESEEDQKWISDMIGLVDYIKGNKTWKNNISQIHIDDNGDVVLIPSEGREKIILGGMEELDRKFEQLEYYYTCIKPAKEEDYYYTVNLKFENQIICRQ